MQNRIDRLEGLVLSLMTNGTQSAGPAAAAAAISRSQSDSVGSITQDLGDDDDMIKEEDEEDEDSEVEVVRNSLGVLKVDADKGKSMYMGESHWHLVLQEVSRSLFGREAHFECCLENTVLVERDTRLT
jgi:hypothetical protein